MNTLLICYVFYLGVTLTLTAGVTALLWQQGRTILAFAYRGQPEVAGAMIHLQGVGYFLFNTCNIILAFGVGQWPTTMQDAPNFLCLKIGWVLLVLTGTYYWRLERVEEVYREFVLRPAPPALVK